MTQPAPTLNPDEIEFARHFIGWRPDHEIARMMKRRVERIKEFRTAEGVPECPRKSPKSKGLVLVLCYRCGVVKFVTRVKADGEPEEPICRWCREEIRAGQADYRHRWAV